MNSLLLMIATILLLAHSATADALKYSVRGGLAGAAVGVLASELSDSTDPRYAIPFYTGIGALTGYALHRHRRHYTGPRRHYAGSAYGVLPYLALPYAYHRSTYWRQPEPRRQAIFISHEHDTQPAAKPEVNRHPGVRLVSVPVPLPSGTINPITILKLGDRYIGPRGEAYETMPDAEILRERYHP